MADQSEQYNFDKRSAERIAKVVKQVERQGLGGPAGGAFRMLPLSILPFKLVEDIGTNVLLDGNEAYAVGFDWNAESEVFTVQQDTTENRFVVRDVLAIYDDLTADTPGWCVSLAGRGKICWAILCPGCPV